MKDKKLKQCEACGILEHGDICREKLSSYRGHKICTYCIGAWKKLDRKLGRESTSEELINPKGIGKKINGKDKIS